MANVREVVSTGGNSLFLSGNGGLPEGMMWVGRASTGTGDQPTMAIVDAPTTTLGTIYVADNDTLHYGTTSGIDVAPASAITINTTNLWLLGTTKVAGTTAIRFHAANLTTGATPVHSSTSSTFADPSGSWDQTEIGTADGGAFEGQMRHGVVGVFQNAYSDADFNSVATALTTQSIGDLMVAGDLLADLNQASTATAIVNLLTGSSVETEDVGTVVQADTAFDIWTFGYTPGASDPPVNTAAPVASGDAVVGETVAVTTGTWDNTPTSYSYQWQRRPA